MACLDQDVLPYIVAAAAIKRRTEHKGMAPCTLVLVHQFECASGPNLLLFALGGFERGSCLAQAVQRRAVRYLTNENIHCF